MIQTTSLIRYFLIEILQRFLPHEGDGESKTAGRQVEHTAPNAVADDVRWKIDVIAIKRLQEYHQGDGLEFNVQI